MLGKLIKGMAGLRVVDQEHEIPDWMGALLDGTDANGLLIKGAGHKYLRRVPKAGGGFRYFYNVTGGHGIGHGSEMVKDAAFKVKHAGKEGHFHITQDHGEEVTVRHDESGHEQRMSKAALRAMLHQEHAEALGAVKARASKVLEQAKKTGTAKQQEKAAALVSKYGGESKGATSMPLHLEIARYIDRLPNELKKLEQSRFDIMNNILNGIRPDEMEDEDKIDEIMDKMGDDFRSQWDYHDTHHNIQSFWKQASGVVSEYVSSTLPGRNTARLYDDIQDKDFADNMDYDKGDALAFKLLFDKLTDKDKIKKDREALDLENKRKEEENKRMAYLMTKKTFSAQKEKEDKLQRARQTEAINYIARHGSQVGVSFSKIFNDMIKKFPRSITKQEAEQIFDEAQRRSWH
jgi:hypothetical protein